LYKIDRNFACFWPQIFWGRQAPILDIIYKIEPNSDHVAKFRGDRPRELGDYALKKETSRAKYKTFRTIVRAA